ncbi:NYN domain-containing protein [Desmonostoc muscorum CCALA 125]|nr:NYN domain-containing protein [Desmonostoc muscorum CCALA 125]
MTDIHIVSNGQTSNQQNLYALYWDIQNVQLKSKQLLYFASKLQDFADSNGRLNCQNVYYNCHHKNQAIAKNILESLGFKCINVPCPLKNSADNQLIADCIKWVAFNPSSNKIILVLGDWDYAGLICILKALGKKVIIFAQRGNASQKLIKLVGNDNFHFIDELDKFSA